MSSKFEFEATCEPTDLRTCQAGTKFLNPCDCSQYFQCTNAYSMSNLSCNPGTLWNYKLGNCDHDTKVEIHQNCSQDNSWTRCNTTANRLDELRSLCTGSTTITPNMTAKPPDGTPDPETKVDPGMVAGLILAGVVITLAAIALYVLYSRRKKANEQKLKRRTTAENREYFEGGPADGDPYAIIDERMIGHRYVNQSINNNNVINGSMNGTLTTTIPDDENMAEYDNSAFREQESDYTATLPRAPGAPLSPYDFLNTSTKSYEKPKSIRDSDVSNVDDDAIVASSSGIGSSVEDGNVPQDVVNVDTGVGTSDIISDVPPSDDNGLNNGDLADDMQSPDYYKLEPE